jgi:hypothetical protein
MTLPLLTSTVNDVASPDLDTFRRSVIIAGYTGKTATSFTGVGGFLYADGTLFSTVVPDADAEWESLVAPGFKVSGRTSFSVDVSPFVGGTLQSRNVVGWEGASGVEGFRYLTFRGPGSDVTFDALGPDITSGPVPALGKVGIIPGAVGAQGVFGPGTDTEDRILYLHVPVGWAFNLTSAQWESINIPAGSAGVGTSAITCLLPGTEVETSDGGGTAGLHIQTGIFLEPSWPTPVFDLSTGGPHVVDNDNSLASTEIGMRNADDFLVIGTILPEPVSFEVRRIRRFHDVNGVIGQNFEPLRYAYEIRRGRITAYTTNDQQFGLVTADGFTMNWEGTKPGGAPRAPDVWNDGKDYTGTNLGEFDHPDVNIHPGDLFRLLDENGDLVEEAVIAQVVDGSALKLEPPGLTVTPAVGQRFEVYLRRAPVPHEQSNEELLNLITDRLVHRTFSDEVAETGGYVPANTADTNKLFDDLNAPGGVGDDFDDLGVRVGDIVIIDPMGTQATTGETGVFHLGDIGLTDRGFYSPGGPNDLDDNRGWYRVTSVEAENGAPPHLVVTGASTFTGIDNADVKFPPDLPELGLMGYAVYPTVGGSALTGGTEGQMDLRPTAPPFAGSHGTNNYSMRPFSYRIIRPSTLFSDEAIDLILMHRERILSTQEFFKSLMTGERTGNYFVFQRDLHLQDLGDPTDFLAGTGVLTNGLIESVVGEVNKSPYYNSASGLSLHDRRFWILDRRLDSLVPDTNIGSRVYDPLTDNPWPLNLGPYTAYTDEDSSFPGALVRPVLPDRIDALLDTDDRFRPLRFTWLAYRTHRVLGTLASLDRADAELADRLAEQERLLDLQQAAEGVES